jgi:asparagine synthase (glutamine-hydrolysing)
MCGIAGVINPSGINLKNMMNAMLHRGPNEQTIEQKSNLAFIHVRLSIQDIANGKQPMSIGSNTIIFNGEIYNHIEVRNKYNLDCLTNSDTETFLRLYEKKGIDCLNDLDGMFAFAIHDEELNQVILGRDRAGEKPLYYSKYNDKFLFASELNVLRAAIPLEVNEKNIYEYLRLGSFYQENTPYKNVYELKSGSYLVVNVNDLTMNMSSWWSIDKFFKKSSPDGLNTSLETIDKLLRTSIKRRIDTSDLEVGCFLSGGIDSGLVTSIASEYKPSLKTFTVSFGNEFDEAPLAKLVADKYKTDHTEIRISFDNLSNDIEKILDNYGEPFYDSSAIPSYYVSKAAKEHVTVILNGDGADELFGGYRRYIPFSKIDFFNKNYTRQLTSKILKNILPVANNKKSMYNYIYRMIDFSSKKGIDTYLTSTSDIFEGYVHHFKQNDITNSNDELRRFFANVQNTGVSGLKKMLLLDFNVFLFGDLLVKMDIATMANSLEGRSPFLSKELLEYSPSMNDSFKINSKNTKYILRKLAERYLPETIISQPKRGFEIPLKLWVNTELREIISDHLINNPYSANYISVEFIRGLVDNKINVPDEKRAKMLWTLFSLEIWHKNLKKEPGNL